MSGDVLTEPTRDRPSAGSSRIFISYRREETAYPAGWLYDRLHGRFGDAQVFKDVDSIKLGDDFVEVITTAVGSCDVLLALIGERWSQITDDTGGRRLDDPNDFVRLEIEAALARDVRVIPVLVDGAQMPEAGELPASMRGLVRRQALELSPSRFEDDTRLLVRVLESTLAEVRTEQRTQQAPTARDQRRSSWLPMVACLALATTVLALISVLVLRDGSDDSSPALAVDTSPVTSEHGLRLSAMRVDPATAPLVDTTLSVSYALTNETNEPLHLEYTFVGARDPADDNHDTEDMNEGIVVSPGETVTAQGRVFLESAGTWRVWPCYVLAGGRFCPDQWQVVFVPVG